MITVVIPARYAGATIEARLHARIGVAANEKERSHGSRCLGGSGSPRSAVGAVMTRGPSADCSHAPA